MRKRTPRVRKRAQRARQDPLELQHAALVEHDGIEIGWVELRVLEAPLDRAEWKTGIILPTREALFLYGAYRHPIDDECGCRIVIVGRDAEDLHVSTDCAPTSAAAPAGSGSSQSTQGEPSASRATRTAAVARSTSRSAPDCR